MADSKLAANDIVDTRICKIPKSYDGKRENWKHFKVALGGYVGAVSPDLKAMMKLCEALDQMVDPVALGMSLNQVALSGKLWTILTSVLTDKAMDTMCNIEEGNGLEVYRKLARRAIVRTAGHDRGRLIHLINPEADVMRLDYFPRLDTWEEQLKEYERLSGENLPDKIKAGVLSAKLSPVGARQHLALNAHRLVTYQQIKDEIESFVTANSGLDESAMDVGALTWDASANRFVDPKKPWKWWEQKKGGKKGKGKGKHNKGGDRWKGSFADQKGKGKGKKGGGGGGGGARGVSAVSAVSERREDGVEEQPASMGLEREQRDPR